jgi:hypothetical protein
VTDGHLHKKKGGGATVESALKRHNTTQHAAPACTASSVPTALRAAACSAVSRLADLFQHKRLAPRFSHTLPRRGRVVSINGDRAVSLPDVGEVDQEAYTHWLRKAAQGRIIVDHLGKEGLAPHAGYPRSQGYGVIGHGRKNVDAPMHISINRAPDQAPITCDKTTLANSSA